MIHAILIIGHGNHKNILQCIRCIERYNSDPRFKTFIHWDVRSKISETDLELLTSTPSVCGIYQELAGNWASWSLACVTYVLLGNALNYSDTIEHIDYYHIISFDSYMLMDPKMFVKFFETAPIIGNSIVPHTSKKNRRHDMWAFAKDTYIKGSLEHHLLWDRFSLDHSALNNIDQRTCPKEQFNEYLSSLQEQANNNQYIPDPPFEWYWRSQWASLTDVAARQVLSAREWIEPYVCKTKFSDETIIATALMNSPLKNKVINAQIMLTAWTAVKDDRRAADTLDHLTVREIHKIRLSYHPFLFARKFGNKQKADNVFLQAVKYYYSKPKKIKILKHTIKNILSSKSHATDRKTNR